MAHPTEGAADAPAFQSASDKAADFESFLFEGEEPEEQDEDQPENTDGAEEGEDLELEADEGEEDSEPDEPAIAPPPSLNAEEKSVFAQLPPEAQQAWAASENRRNTQVQEATTKAAAKERDAQTALERADAEAAVHYAAQLRVFADAFRPQVPDPQLAYADPQRYIALKAQYDADAAQFDALEQQIAAVREEALGKTTQVSTAQRHADLMTVPELANPETREAHVQWARELVTELGIDPQVFEANADSGDFKSLKQVDAWRQKAIKYDAAMARKMQTVRAGKAKTMRPAAARTDDPRATGKDWQRVKGARSKQERAEAFADWIGL